MPWNTLTNLSSGTIVTETHMDQIRENIEWTGGFGSGGTPFSGFGSAFTNLARMVVGSYTGNGSATQAITGVGFQPTFIIIYDRAGGAPLQGFSMKASNDTTFAKVDSGYQIDHIISLDANGFTVGDGTASSNYMNTSAEVYTYIAFRA
jgi:hypothetical protein